MAIRPVPSLSHPKGTSDISFFFCFPSFFHEPFSPDLGGNQKFFSPRQRDSLSPMNSPWCPLPFRMLYSPACRLDQQEEDLLVVVRPSLFSPSSRPPLPGSRNSRSVSFLFFQNPAQKVPVPDFPPLLPCLLETIWSAH